MKGSSIRRTASGAQREVAAARRVSASARVAHLAKKPRKRCAIAQPYALRAQSPGFLQIVVLLQLVVPLQLVVLLGVAAGLLHRVLLAVAQHLRAHRLGERDAGGLGEEEEEDLDVGELLGDAGAVLGVSELGGDLGVV